MVSEIESDTGIESGSLCLGVTVKIPMKIL